MLILIYCNYIIWIIRLCLSVYWPNTDEDSALLNKSQTIAELASNLGSENNNDVILQKLLLRKKRIQT